MKKTSVFLVATLVVLPILGIAQEKDPAPASKINFEKQIVPIVKASCIGCHNKDNAKDGVQFPDKMTLEDAKKNPKLWRKAGREVKSKHMPPKDHGTMSDKERELFVTWVAETFPKPKG
ncbi:MAG TPA: c-type cytochrome [Fimbriimonas sp.]|nr:c-type cytochrome [Fimbriimonas sp.]